MNIQFTTSVPEEARKRIKKVEPDMPSERVERIVKAVGDGYVRVGDPMMYPNGIPIIPTEKSDELPDGELARRLA